MKSCEAVMSQPCALYVTSDCAAGNHTVIKISAAESFVIGRESSTW